MTVHGHQFSFRARSSRTAANCLTRATAKVKVDGLCLLPGGHPSNHYRSQVFLNDEKGSKAMINLEKKITSYSNMSRMNKPNPDYIEK